MTSNYAGGRQASVLCRQVDAGLKGYCYQGIGTILGTLHLTRPAVGPPAPPSAPRASSTHVCGAQGYPLRPRIVVLARVERADASHGHDHGTAVARTGRPRRPRAQPGRPRPLEPDHGAPLHACAQRATRASWPRAARSSSTPAGSPDARRRTSSSSASRARRSASGGGRSTSRCPRTASTALRDKVVAHLDGQSSSSSTPSPAPTPRTGSPSASSPAARTTRSSRRRCSSSRPPTSWPSSGRRRSSCTRPRSRPTRRPTARAPAPSSCSIRRGRRS